MRALARGKDSMKAASQEWRVMARKRNNSVVVPARARAVVVRKRTHRIEVRA
jgi:hypothetical protein